MEDNSYTIRARIVAEDASGPGTTTVKKKIIEVEEQARKTSSSIMSMFGRAFAFIGGAAGFGMAARQIVGLNSEIEQARSGLAGLYTAQTGLPIAESLKIARAELAHLRKDAALGVGELGDYLTTYQGIVGVALPLGANVDQMRALTRNALAAGFAMQGERGLANAGIDVQQAMGGQVGDRTTPIVMAALRASGMSAEAFRALKPEERIDALNTAFGKFGPAVELMGKSWSAQSSTLLDNTKELVRTATLPLFEVWSEKLRAANDWMAANRDTINEVAGTVGQRLVKLWDHLIRQASTYAAIVAGAALAQPVAGLAGGARGAFGTVAEGARWGASLPGRNGFLGKLGGAAAGGIGEVLAMLPQVGTAFLGVAGPIAAVVTIVLSVVGAMREYVEVSAFVGSSIAYVVESFGSLGVAFEGLTSKGSALNLVGAALLGTLGGLAVLLGGVVRTIATIVVFLGAALVVLGETIKGLYFAATGQWDKAMESASTRVDAVTSLPEKFAAVWATGEDAAGKGKDEEGGEIPKLPVKAGGNTIIQGDVNLQVKTEVNADPARVMRAFDEGISHLAIYKRQAARVPRLT